MRSFHRAFPDSQDPPAFLQQSAAGTFIPLLIPPDFRSPEFCPCGRHSEQMAIMTVPETAMHENDSMVPGKHDVGPARQFRRMQAVAQPCRMETMPQLQLRFRVPAPDPAHVEPPLRRCENIGQGAVPLPVASATIWRSAAAILSCSIPGCSVTAPNLNPALYSGWNSRPGIGVPR